MLSLAAPPRLDASVTAVGVKPAEAKNLAKLGITSVRDLLLELPYGWESYGTPTLVAALQPGIPATVVGTLRAIHTRAPRQKFKTYVKAITNGHIEDDEGGELELVWFNQNFVGKVLDVAEYQL